MGISRTRYLSNRCVFRKLSCDRYFLILRAFAYLIGGLTVTASISITWALAPHHLYLNDRTSETASAIGINHRVGDRFPIRSPAFVGVPEIVRVAASNESGQPVQSRRGVRLVAFTAFASGSTKVSIALPTVPSIERVGVPRSLSVERQGPPADQSVVHPQPEHPSALSSLLRVPDIDAFVVPIVYRGDSSTASGDDLLTSRRRLKLGVILIFAVPLSWPLAGIVRPSPRKLRQSLYRAARLPHIPDFGATMDQGHLMVSSSGSALPFMVPVTVIDSVLPSVTFNESGSTFRVISVVRRLVVNDRDVPSGRRSTAERADTVNFYPFGFPDTSLSSNNDEGERSPSPFVVPFRNSESELTLRSVIRHRAFPPDTSAILKASHSTLRCVRSSRSCQLDFCSPSSRPYPTTVTASSRHL